MPLGGHELLINHWDMPYRFEASESPHLSADTPRSALDRAQTQLLRSRSGSATGFFRISIHVITEQR